ncbi:MAG: YgjV family protein [Chitinophagaceae bacterium]|nr:YgjV family protein [Chitinophagaceae bacterium]
MLSQIAPWIGYLASILLALGLLVNNDIKFRWLNSGGCVAFIIYGIFLNAIPIILTNGILLAINLVWLYKMYNRQELFELLEFDTGGIMVDRFLAFYQTDIGKFFPDFKREHLAGNLNFVVLRDLVIANIFSASVKENGDAEVILNYTVPKYRDFKVGRFIFDKEKRYLLSKGVKRIVYHSVANGNHRRFLEVMQFATETINGHQGLVKNIT